MSMRSTAARFPHVLPIGLIALSAISILAFASVSQATTFDVPAVYPTLTAAVSAAADGDSIRVAPGTYTGEGFRDISFLGKEVVVYAPAGPESTIIDGGFGRGFLFESGETRGATLDGFTLTRFSASFGGAIYCANGSAPTIRNCVLAGNEAGESSRGTEPGSAHVPVRPLCSRDARSHSTRPTVRTS